MLQEKKEGNAMEKLKWGFSTVLNNNCNSNAQDHLALSLSIYMKKPKHTHSLGPKRICKVLPLKHIIWLWATSFSPFSQVNNSSSREETVLRLSLALQHHSILAVFKGMTGTPPLKADKITPPYSQFTLTTDSLKSVADSTEPYWKTFFSVCSHTQIPPKAKSAAHRIK